MVTTIKRAYIYEPNSFSRPAPSTSKIRTNTIFIDRERLKAKGRYFYYKGKGYISSLYSARA